MSNTFRENFSSQGVLFGEVGKLQRFFQVIVFDPDIETYTSCSSCEQTFHDFHKLLTSNQCQIERAFENLTTNTERATKKTLCFWGGL